ncbi:hypothetical protein BH11BAC3_BH11BAC3_40330 [soil metagenome]
MDHDFYLAKFTNAAAKLNKKTLSKKKLEVGVGVVLESVYLKLYKKEWTNNTADPLNAKSRIFFSIWINEKTIQEQKIFYNIHALKLRELRNYNIASRAFADEFRKRFKQYHHNWENVSIKFGPLTLMEGWQKYDIEKLEKPIVHLANNFIAIDYLIDEALQSFPLKAT